MLLHIVKAHYRDPANPGAWIEVSDITVGLKYRYPCQLRDRPDLMEKLKVSTEKSGRADLPHPLTLFVTGPDAYAEIALPAAPARKGLRLMITQTESLVSEAERCIFRRETVSRLIIGPPGIGKTSALDALIKDACNGPMAVTWALKYKGRTDKDGKPLPDPNPPWQRLSHINVDTLWAALNETAEPGSLLVLDDSVNAVVVPAVQHLLMQATGPVSGKTRWVDRAGKGKLNYLGSIFLVLNEFNVEKAKNPAFVDRMEKIVFPSDRETVLVYVLHRGKEILPPFLKAMKFTGDPAPVIRDVLKEFPVLINGTNHGGRKRRISRCTFRSLTELARWRANRPDDWREHARQNMLDEVIP